jgi:hypothetical protein
MSVSSASGIDRHAACQRNGHVSLNTEAAHCLPVEWTGRRLVAEWAGLIKCRDVTLLARRRALSAINAGAAQPGGLTSGPARWLMSRAAGHVVASRLRLGGEQKRMQTGLHQAGPRHVSTPNPCLALIKAWVFFGPEFRDPAVSGPDPMQRGPIHARGGPEPYLEVWPVYAGVQYFLMGIQTHC